MRPLRPGEPLLFYTDGLIEGRTFPGGVRSPGWTDVLRVHTEPAQALIGRLVAPLLPQVVQSALEDDVTALVVVPPAELQFDLPSREGEEIAAAARAADFARRHGPTGRADDVATAVGEACLNALSHGNRLRAEARARVRLAAQMAPATARCGAGACPVGRRGGRQVSAAGHPSLPRPHVARPALVARVLEHRVTLLRAPAGYGKTALLAEVLNGGEGILNADADRGILHVCEACGRLAQGPPDVPRILAVDHIEALAGDSADWGALDRCVADLPPGCRLVLAGRAVPPLPALTRLRLSGDLLVLGARELRFTDEECARLLELLGRTGQAEAALAEEWPVALRLLALDGAGRPGADPADRESRLGEVMAYVAREIAQEAGELRLLADLSVIDDWNQEAVSGLLECAGAAPCPRGGVRRPGCTAAAAGCGG